MSDMPLVSVLMPLYNKATYVAEAIVSVLNQTYPNIELIIVDDGSTDAGFKCASGFVSDKVFLFSQNNKGASAARNKAFSHAKGDFIQYLDADDLLHPHKIAEQMKCLSDKSLAIATAHWQYFETDIAEYRQDENPALRRDFDDVADFLLQITCKGLPIHAWLIPRLAIEKAGLWDESIYTFEDRDFYLRLIPSLKSIVFCDAAFCYYRMPQIHQNLSTRTDKQVLMGALRYIDNAEAYFLKINHPQVRSTLACLYKKLLLVSTHEADIVQNLRDRSVKLGLAPDCNKNAFIGFCEKIMGIRLTFWLVYFKVKIKECRK